MMKDM